MAELDKGDRKATEAQIETCFNPTMLNVICDRTTRRLRISHEQHGGLCASFLVSTLQVGVRGEMARGTYSGHIFGPLSTSSTLI